MKMRIMEEVKVETKCPEVCTKPGCGGRVFLPHEDGWQCFNCMKIIYKHPGVADLPPVAEHHHSHN